MNNRIEFDIVHIITPIKQLVFDDKKMEDSTMTNSNKTSVPEAKESMNKFKMEVANEMGVNLKQGYNGDLTSKEAGSIGGEMVRQMIKNQEQQMSGK